MLAEEFAPGFYQWGYGAPEDFSGIEYQEISAREFSETAVFGELGYRFTDRWQVTVGARWFDYEDEVSRQVAFPFFDDVSFDRNKTGDNETIFKLNTSYEVTSDVMGYLTVSQGYRTGGLNLGPLCEDPLPDDQTFCLREDEVLIKPDSTTNYEAGLRSLWLDGRLLLNAAVYYIDWEDIQVRGSSDIGDLPITKNGGSAETKGIELMTRWSITDSLELLASVAYNEAQLTSYAPGLVDGADAFAGDRLPGSPEEQGTLVLDYARPLDNGWTFNANYSLTAVGDVQTQVGQYGEVLPGYAIHGLSVGVGSGPWRASLYADNVFDKYAVTSVRRDRGYIYDVERDALSSIPSRTYYQSILRPRTVGLEFAYRFDL